ncbi:hypothetical protein BDV11DRAFT_110354 [Aspergillus similis]
MRPGLDGPLVAIYGVCCGASSRSGWWRLEAQAALRFAGITLCYAGILCLCPGMFSYAGELGSVRTGTGPCVAIYLIDVQNEDYTSLKETEGQALKARHCSCEGVCRTFPEWK